MRAQLVETGAQNISNEKARPWTMREIAELRRLAPMGAATIAEILGRSTKSVQKQAHTQRISLRRAGETRGLILGQPAGISFTRGAFGTRALLQLREDVLAGRVDVERIERRARLLTRGGQLCPSCSKRPVEVSMTGLCEDCHVRELADNHALEADRLEAERLLDRERQRKHRRKAGKGGKP